MRAVLTERGVNEWPCGIKSRCSRKIGTHNVHETNRVDGSQFFAFKCSYLRNNKSFVMYNVGEVYLLS
jgi:hypothetical protein